MINYIRTNNKLKIYILLFVITALTAGWSFFYLYSVAKESNTLAAKQFPAPGTNNSYENTFMAMNLVDYHVFSRSEMAPFEPDVFRTPGYPLFLAPFYAVFGNFYPAVVAQIFLLFLITVLIFKMADKLVGQKWALALSILYLFLPSTMLFTSFLTNEILFVFLFISALYIFFFSEWKSLYLKWALTGLLFALATYVRPASLYILFFFIPAYFIFYIKWKEISRKEILAALLLVVVFLGVLAPWCYRNWKNTGIFAFTSVGPYVLLRHNAAQFYESMTGLNAVESRNALLRMAGMPEGTVPADLKYYDAMKETALKVIFAHPFRYSIFHASTFITFFTTTGSQEYIILVRDMKSDAPRPSEPSFLQAIHPFSFATLMIVIKNHGWTLVENSFWGLVTLLVFMSVFWSKNPRIHRIFLIVAIFFAFVTGPMAHGRYRMPVESLLLINAFAAASFLWEKRTSFPLRAVSSLLREEKTKIEIAEQDKS